MTRGRSRVLATAVVLALLFPATATAYQLAMPASQNKTPPGFRLSGRQAVAIAARTEAVRKIERDQGPLYARTATPLGTKTWQVGFFHGKQEVARTTIDGVTGRRLEPVWTGPKVLWPSARGIDTPWRNRIDAAMVVLAVLFLLPFAGRGRPRLLQLDLLAFVAFGVSFLLLQYGHPYASVPAQYVPLLYLLGRLLYIALRSGGAARATMRFPSERLMTIGIVTLVIARIAFNLAGAPVGDVGFAGLFGANSVRTGYPLYGTSPTHLDAYGPLNYLLYVPFEAAWPLGSGWSRAHVDGARTAAILFDLAVLVLLIVLARRLRPGRDGRRLGLTLAYAWVAFPFAFFPLALSSNDALVAITVLMALLLYGSARGRGAALGLGAATKLAPISLVPVFGPGRERSTRSALVCAGVAAAIVVASFVPYASESSVGLIWSRTVGFQMHRDSPFTLWGLHPSLGWVHVLAEVLAAAVVVGSAFVPRERTPIRIAALSAATILVVQMAGTYWAHTYVAWFAAPAFVALFGCYAGEPAMQPAQAAAPSAQPPLRR